MTVPWMVHSWFFGQMVQSRLPPTLYLTSSAVVEQSTPAAVLTVQSVPGLQSEHSMAPSREYVPSGQGIPAVL